MSSTRHVGIIGAGIVGLSTAWFLQQRGVQVTVLDRAHPGAGASWGNAGWLTPELTTPLPHPSVLRFGLRTLLSPTSPVYLPAGQALTDPRLLRFLTGFARHSTHRHWMAAMRTYAPMNQRALAAFDALEDGGVAASTIDAEPFLACFSTTAERDAMLVELGHLRAVGQDVKVDALSGDEVRSVEPALSPAVGAALRLHGQRYIHPPAYVQALAGAVHSRLGTFVTDRDVRQVRARRDGVLVVDATGTEWHFDDVVVANGARLGDLARPFGVRRPVQAGRGYSFTVAGDIPNGPVYFPEERVACTPLVDESGARLRVAGMMEFRDVDAPLDPRRIDAVVEAVRPLFTGIDLDARQEEWVGARPCTPDGLPLIGPTRSSRVFVAGGHGMWGVIWGPLTGQLLAEAVTTGITPSPLLPFDPTR